MGTNKYDHSKHHYADKKELKVKAELKRLEASEAKAIMKKAREERASDGLARVILAEHVPDIVKELEETKEEKLPEIKQKKIIKKPSTNIPPVVLEQDDDDEILNDILDDPKVFEDYDKGLEIQALEDKIAKLKKEKE